MSVLLEATLNRRSSSFAKEIATLKEKTVALQRQNPDRQLLTGKREEGDKVHVVVMLAKGRRVSPTTERNVICTF